MEVAHSRPCGRRMVAAASRCMPNACQAPSAAHAAPSTSARSNMRYGLLAVVLIGIATLGGCTEGVFDPKGPIALAERQILLNALGIMLAIVTPVILATLCVFRPPRDARLVDPRHDRLPGWRRGVGGLT